MPSPNFIANSTIQPSVFVSVDTSIDNACNATSGTATEIIGIAQEWTKYPPIPGASTEAADAGDPIKVYGLGDICLLQSTSAGWTSGDRLTANSAGTGAITASTTNHYGAVALTTMSAAGLGRVQVIIGAGV